MEEFQKDDLSQHDFLKNYRSGLRGKLKETLNSFKDFKRMMLRARAESSGEPTVFFRLFMKAKNYFSKSDTKRLELIKKKIDEGRYKVDHKKVASKILSEHLNLRD